MIKLLPILLAVIYALALYRFSSWRMSRELDAKTAALDDPELNGLCQDMAHQVNLPNLPVQIYEVEPVNGLATADGRIVITRGLYQKYRSGEISAQELASVIAHELGHVALGHSKRRMIDFSGQTAARVVLATILARFIPIIGPWIATTLMSLVAAKLSRRDEYEADAYAAALLVKAQIGIAPQISLFEKLDQITKTNTAAMPAWLMSHPKTTERIGALRELEARWHLQKS